MNLYKLTVMLYISSIKLIFFQIHAKHFWSGVLTMKLVADIVDEGKTIV